MSLDARGPRPGIDGADTRILGTASTVRNGAGQNHPGRGDVPEVRW